MTLNLTSVQEQVTFLALGTQGQGAVTIGIKKKKILTGCYTLLTVHHQPRDQLILGDHHDKIAR